VLRHYRRGGLVARLSADAYLWTGASRTRSFREWRLLHQLREWQLPVPEPVAANYVRSGLVYRADLITVELPVRRTVAQALADGPLAAHSWEAIGRCVGRLHARGVHHADLNAHNLLLGADDTVYVLDFDRGRVRPRGAWENDVLARLDRSLRKVTSELPADRYGQEPWRALLAGVEES
jgi:3-deoxy-D-manno-octulosonic acid kinase